VILNVLVCDILINVLIQTSALVGPLYIAVTGVCGNILRNIHTSKTASAMLLPLTAVYRFTKLHELRKLQALNVQVTV
jgi:hypothetical protein